MMTFQHFIETYFWVPIVIGVLVMIILAFVVCYCCRRYGRNSHYEYVPLLSKEPSLYERFNFVRESDSKSAKTDNWLNAQYYLRANQQYSNVHQLESLGSRPHKYWFRVSETASQSNLLMTIIEKQKQMSMPFNAATRKTVKDMLQLLKHPYIFAIRDLDFMEDQGLVVVVYPACRRGSLKDYIYHENSCVEPWQNKYTKRQRGLNVTQIRGFGKQILTALLYIQEKGYPPHSHVHSGNIVIESNSCRLMGCESSLLCEEPRLLPILKRKLRKNKDAIDVLCFGHVIYEMCVGHELDSAHPDPAQLNLCKSPDVVKVLNFIFPQDRKDYPTLKQIAELEFFSQVPLPELESYNFSPISLNRDMRALVKSIRTGVAIPLKSSRRNSKFNASRTSLADSVSTTDIPSMSRRPSVVTSSVPPPPPGPPPPPPPGAPPPPPPAPAPPPPSLAPPPSSGGRSALLGGIRGGMKLKKTVTNDRSGPKV